MTNIDHLPPDEQKHFIPCACGHFVDMRNLADVFDHLHASLPAEPQWTYAIRNGEARAYPRGNGGPLELN